MLESTKTSKQASKVDSVSNNECDSRFGSCTLVAPTQVYLARLPTSHFRMVNVYGRNMNMDMGTGTGIAIREIVIRDS